MHKKLRWILLTILVFFIAITSDRFFLLFTSGYFHGLSSNIFKALWLGARYDLRQTGVLAVVMLLLSAIPFSDPFKSAFGKKFWTVFLSMLSVLVVFIYVMDVMHFDYLSQRLNSSILNFIPEGGTSAAMVWQTYPVIRLLLLIALLSAVMIYFINKAYRSTAKKIEMKSNKRIAVNNVVLFLLCALCIFGRLDQYPLRWSDAFELGDNRLSQLALNPIQSFLSSMSFRHVSFDEKATSKYYPMMAGYLGLDTAANGKPRFVRHIAGTASTKPNVVLVICESFSAYKSSMWGNPLNTTPYFNSLCKDGVFFDHCFTPHFGTARGVWATITGTPDVLLDKTASRDPLIVDQHSIISDFEGYQKDYFIGGSTSWANIKGVINNISGINIHEQGSYSAKKVDVWGISDKNLFLQANEVLHNKATPFFTVIQTSDNHRPYTIPKEDQDDFKMVSYPRDSLVRYGFQSNDELNAFRYTDFCFQRFMETAKKEPYFNNTIFVFIGDHGIRGNAGDMFPKAWTDNSLTCFHVPLLFYAPAILKPAKHTMISSQVDVMPTIAGMAGIPYTNSTMGRDLLHLADTTLNIAFLIDHDVRNIAVVHGDYLFQRHLFNYKEILVSVSDNHVISKDSLVVLSNHMRDLTLGFYEASRFMLFNNSSASVRK
jgi:phosphoglycerol transferase MdoB-like AlkP superfamily enzyme